MQSFAALNSANTSINIAGPDTGVKTNMGIFLIQRFEICMISNFWAHGKWVRKSFS